MSETKYFPEKDKHCPFGIGAILIDDRIELKSFLEEDTITIRLDKSSALRFAESIQNEVAKMIEVEVEENVALFPNTQFSVRKTKAPSIDFNQIKDIFNSVCTELPKVKIMSTERKRMISSIEKEYGLESIGEVFNNASESDFMKGHNPQGWTATFDWIFNKKNFVKILEGNYKNKIAKPANNETVIGRQTKETFINNASDWEIN